MPAPRLTVRHLMGLVGLAAFGLALDSAPGGCACGFYPLRVELRVPPGRPVVAVAACVENDLKRAGQLLQLTEGPSHLVSPVRWTPGRPFEVGVPFSATMSSLTQRPLSRRQARALILRVGQADGTSRWLVREIPDRLETRELVVDLR